MRNFVFMHLHSLSLDDFSEDSYTLIGIHTTLEDYKLAYLLNRTLKTTFAKANFSLDFDKNKSNATYSVFNHTCSENDLDWYLITNNFSEENSAFSQDTLFKTETKSFLIPEKKNIDYFIKIIGETDYEFIYNTVNSIKNIKEVITSYTIDLSTLKSKESLIF